MAQSRNTNENTLFHLVPVCQLAEDALQHPDNQAFVSSSAVGSLGLEIGFHVPPFSRGHVITKLGKDSDLILPKSFSAVHVAFEIHQVSFVVMLSVRTKRNDSVKVTIRNEDDSPQVFVGGCAIMYGEKCRISIAAYDFEVVWRKTDCKDNHDDSRESLRRLAIEGYKDSLARLKLVRSRDLSIPEPPTSDPWGRMKARRLAALKEPVVIEFEGTRELIGQGMFGKVFKARDLISTNYFAIKSVNLKRRSPNIELARAALHKEVKVLEKVSHPNIIKCLGTKDFDTDEPLIFMPWLPGSLDTLVKAKGAPDELCAQVLMQMLSALDYLAFHKLCHRDVKPANILYYHIPDGDKYNFQLADFGLASECRLATTFCGTGYYQAPEFYNLGPQTPKIDVWSLFASILDIHPAFDYPPKEATCYSDVQRALEDAAATPSAAKIKPMARIDPDHRASAAQMLVALFNGQGLTTPKVNIPSIEPENLKPRITPEIAEPAPAVDDAEPAPKPAPLGLGEYLRRRRRLYARLVRQPWILPNRFIPAQHQPQLLYRARRYGIAKPLAMIPQYKATQRRP